MTDPLDFISSGDKPALMAFSTPDWLDTAKADLQGLGYKVHTAATHSDFLTRFTQTRYELVLIEDLFNAHSLEENLALKALQNMSTGQRRHATVLLIGQSFQTFAPMEAFKYSVHAVINSSEIFLLKQLAEKAVADNNAFLQNFRAVQTRIFSNSNHT
jgi:hypothetical protein